MKHIIILLLITLPSFTFSQNLDIQLSGGVAPASIGESAATINPHVDLGLGLHLGKWRAGAEISLMQFGRKYEDFYPVLNRQTATYELFDYKSTTALIIPSVSLQRSFSISRISLLIGPKFGLVIPSNTNFDEYDSDPSGIIKNERKTKLYSSSYLIALNGAINIDLTKKLYLLGSIQPSYLKIKGKDGSSSDGLIIPISIGIGFNF